MALLLKGLETLVQHTANGSEKAKLVVSIELQPPPLYFCQKTKKRQKKRRGKEKWGKKACNRTIFGDTVGKEPSFGI